MRETCVNGNWIKDGKNAGCTVCISVHCAGAGYEKTPDRIQYLQEIERSTPE